MHQFLVTQYRHSKASEILAPIMFAISFLILVTLAALVVIWVEIPRFELAGDINQPTVLQENQLLISTAAQLGNYLVLLAWSLGAIIILEVLAQYFLQRKKINPDNAFKWRMITVAQLLCPPLRLAAPSLEMDGQIWLPAYGWQKPGRKLFKQLQNRFSRPMLAFALLILPILLIEFALRGLVQQVEGLRLTLHVCTGIIWCAFAVEFIVLLNVSDRKFDFVKKHWIDLAIILLPIIMFLRSLRALQILRFSKFAKLQQLTNLARIYRVRGVAMKALRALMMLEIFGRLLPVPLEKRLQRLQRELNDKREDIEELQIEIEKVKAQIELEELKCEELELENENERTAEKQHRNDLPQAVVSAKTRRRMFPSVNLDKKPLYPDATTSDNVADGNSV